MTEQQKLILALQQVNNLSSLLKDNEWYGFLSQRLISVKCELERQLTNISGSSKIKTVQNK